jgi:hypothetical protein
MQQIDRRARRRLSSRWSGSGWACTRLLRRQQSVKRELPGEGAGFYAVPAVTIPHIQFRHTQSMLVNPELESSATCSDKGT